MSIGTRLKKIFKLEDEGIVQNLYLPTVQKAGSQWVKQIFCDPEVVQLTNLRLYPQHHYDGHEFHEEFPSNTFIPGLYISYLTYWLYVKKKDPYKTIYIYRDPRNIVVSWYWSALKSHSLSPQIKLIREKLEIMSLDEGLLYAIRHHSEKYGQIRSWIELGQNDSHVLIKKFEELASNPFEEFNSIFEFIGVDISREKLNRILSKYSKKNMREADLMNRKKKDISHYKKDGSNYRKVFKEEHYELFYEITGNLIEVLGYDK